MSRPYRPRLACQACTRKKIKCDKLAPCGNCVKRGQPELCARESPHDDRDSAVTLAEPMPPPPSSDPPSQHMEQLVRSLLERVEQLESQSRQQQPNQQQLQNARRSPQQPSSALVPDPGNLAAEAQYHAGGDMGGDMSVFLGNGTSGEVVTAGTDALAPCTPAGSSSSLRAVRSMLREDNCLAQSKIRQIAIVQLLLPDRNRVEQLVQYHTESLLWSHGGYHVPTFRHDLARFYDVHLGQITSVGVDLQWVALLFAILSGAIISAPFPLAQRWGFRKDEQHTLSESWYDATLECLHLSEHLTRHRLDTLQAIVVLTTSAYLLGRMRSQSVLMATAIRMAQNLGLDRLGEEPEGLSEGIVPRESGRRAWYALLRQDYFFIPFAESYLVRPMFNRTDPPRNCRDEDMVSLPDSVPTVMSYCRLLDKIAALMPELHDSLLSCRTVYERFEEIIRFDSEMRALATVHRPPFLADSPIDPTWPRYIAWARRALTISFAHKVIMIHRNMLSRSMTDPVFSFTRKTCVAASKTILKMLQQSQPFDEDRPILWIEQAFTVTAGVILCFDMLYRSPLDTDPSPTHRSLIQDAITNLKQVDQCIIARKGVRLLTALLQECTAWPPRNKRTHDEMSAEAAWHDNTMQVLDVETFIQGFWKRKGDLVASSVSPPGQIPMPQTPQLMQGTLYEKELDWLGDYWLYGAFQEQQVPAPNGSEQVPSFEDLLFRAEDFSF
ncbi:hypothetical protein QBC33DRAFT_256299 [Phialemonium atrogriseum]|uniref:Zn(2)-C6 fungal-type domain-containing protein n=1 Tax=Phialemonium atrogriseum TaxID=1093897 RepID=A0AAJ0FGT8_9PEZI|nr:uncharacterized protein QBC33DRAFT_256299 [Phialemonium atrogriseum]KAK1762688.1 hypothetical protein QBC33DRAFT_256299 [Phialemonium atrogriseum]